MRSFPKPSFTFKVKNRYFILKMLQKDKDTVRLLLRCNQMPSQMQNKGCHGRIKCYYEVCVDLPKNLITLSYRFLSDKVICRLFLVRLGFKNPF